MSTAGRVGGLFDFENRRLGTDLPPFFPGVDARFKFCALIFGGDERRFDQTQCAFFLPDTGTLADENRCFPLTSADFARVNPNSGTAPVFRTRRDAEITRRIYERQPVLVDRSGDVERRAWPVRFMQGHFNMTSDSHLFRTAEQLEAEGFYPVEGNRWKRGGDLYLPLYEGKMVQAFDHRAASITTREGNLFRPGQPDRTLEEKHGDPAFSPRPRYWVNQQESDVLQGVRWLLAFKDITASTNVRTMIAAVIPQVGCGHTLPVLLPSEDGMDAESAACFLANLNSFAFDYVARQKVQATHLTWYNRRAVPGHCTYRLRPPLRRDHRPRPRQRPRPPPHVHRPRHGPLRPRPRPRRPALPLGRGGTPPPPGTPRRPLLPPLRPHPGGCGVRARHLPDRPPGGRGSLRPLPHPGADPGLHERPGGGGCGGEGGGVSALLVTYVLVNDLETRMEKPCTFKEPG